MVVAFAYNRVPRTPSGVVPQRTGMPNTTYILVAATALMMGLRYQVGGDWFNYLNNYNIEQILSYSNALDQSDPAYATLVFIAGRLNAGMFMVNLVCAVIMSFGVARFCSRQPNPALSFLVAIPYLIIVVGMGYTRQGVAIGLIMAGLAEINERSIGKFVVFVACAALFHKTAVLVLPIALAPLLRRNMLYAIGGVIAFLLLSLLLLRDAANQLVTNYVAADYQSSGATVRVFMNVPPAILALIFRKNLGFPQYQREVWLWFAVAALATFPLVLAADFTTAIDRMALFFIPLQMAILGRFPYMFGDRKILNMQAVLAVCGYSGFVELVWLVFATNSKYWVPYHAFFI
jgi:hypothetical protein